MPSQIKKACSTVSRAARSNEPFYHCTDGRRTPSRSSEQKFLTGFLPAPGSRQIVYLHPVFAQHNFAKKKLIRFSRRVFAQLAKKMVLGDLALKEPKDSNHARQRCTGRLRSCSAVTKTSTCQKSGSLVSFFETLPSTKGVCSETVGATYAASSSARHSHRIFACTCRNRTSARAPSPESTAPRAEHIVGEEKVAFFCFETPVAGCIQGCSHSGELARHVLAHVMNSMAKCAVEGG